MRKRIRRKQIPHERDEDGRLYVYLDEDETANKTSQDESQAQSRDDRDMLIEFLRNELAVWQEEARRKDHIIAALTERIPAIEAPSEPREGHETATENSGKGDVPPEQERRSWWRRMFGG